MNDVKQLVIIGAGAQGCDILWTVNDCNKQSKKFNVIGFLDENKSIHNTSINNIKILGDFNWFFENDVRNYFFVIGIGDGKIREKIVKKLEKHNLNFCSIIHPSVIYAESVSIGNGTVIQAGVKIAPNCKIGDHVLINLNSIIGHDTILKDYVTISPTSVINGESLIELGTYIGSASVIQDTITIGKWSVIGIGSIVNQNIPAYSVYVNPNGRVIKNIEDESKRPKL